MHQALQAKKLVLVSTTSLLVTGAKETQRIRVLNWIAGICYPMQFQNNKGKDGLPLIDFESKVNVKTPTYAAQLGLKVQTIKVGAQKIDGFSPAPYSMVIAAFQVLDKLGRSQFF